MVTKVYWLLAVVMVAALLWMAYLTNLSFHWRWEYFQAGVEPDSRIRSELGFAKLIGYFCTFTMLLLVSWYAHDQIQRPVEKRQSAGLWVAGIVCVAGLVWTGYLANLSLHWRLQYLQAGIEADSRGGTPILLWIHILLMIALLFCGVFYWLYIRSTPKQPRDAPTDRMVYDYVQYLRGCAQDAPTGGDGSPDAAGDPQRAAVPPIPEASPTVATDDLDHGQDGAKIPEADAPEADAGAGGDPACSGRPQDADHGGGKRRGRRWQKVQADLEALQLAGKPFTSYEDMGDRLGCSGATVHKAIQNGTVELQEWAAKQHGESRLNVSPEAAAVHFDSIPQGREPDPADISDPADTERTLARLVADAGKEHGAQVQAETEARIQAMTPEERESLARLYPDADEKEQAQRRRRAKHSRTE